MMTPAQVAQRANISVGSVRNWSKEYADLLSPQAHGTNGPRLFSNEDVEILCTIAALRKSGVPPGDIAARVRDGQAPPVIDVTPQQSLQEPTQSPQIAQDAPLALYASHNSLQTQIDALARRVEGQQRGALWWAWGMGLWMGIVFSGIVLWVVWLLVNGRSLP